MHTFRVCKTHVLAIRKILQFVFLLKRMYTFLYQIISVYLFRFDFDVMNESSYAAFSFLSVDFLIAIQQNNVDLCVR